MAQAAGATGDKAKKRKRLETVIQIFTWYNLSREEKTTGSHKGQEIGGIVLIKRNI